MATLSSVSADDKLKIIEGSTGDVRTSPGQEHDITVSDLATSLASQTGISSQYSPIRADLSGNRVVWLGDSIMISQASDTVTDTWGISMPSWATYLSKGKLVRIRNAGVVGNTTAQMLARFSTDVTPYSPTLVVIMAGTNDWNDASTTTLAEYATSITALVAACRAIGAQPVLCTVPPNTISTNRRTRTITGNAWLRRYCSLQGIPLVDIYNLLVDPSTGTYLSAYALDGTHPNNAGYAAMGSFLWTALSTWVNPVDQLLPMDNSDPNNKLTNGLNLTTTGSGTSLMPTGWTVQTAHPTGVTGSLDTSDTSIKGNWWQVVASGASSTNNEYQSVSSIVPGHTYAHVGRFKATGMRGADSGSGSTFLIGHAYNSSLLAAGYDFRVASTHSYNLTEGVFYQESVAPSDASTCLVRRQLLNTTSGNGTLAVAQTGFYDLTAMGLV